MYRVRDFEIARGSVLMMRIRVAIEERDEYEHSLLCSTLYILYHENAAYDHLL